MYVFPDTPIGPYGSRGRRVSRTAQTLASLMRVCVVNRLAIAQCRSAVSPGSGKRWRATFDFTAHPSIPAVNLQAQSEAPAGS